MKRSIVAALFSAVFLSPAFAGQQFCSDDADTYYVEQIPFGFAVVRASYADLCRREDQSAKKFTCNGDPDYTMNFTRQDDDLLVEMPKGGTMKFALCQVDNAAAYQ